MSVNENLITAMRMQTAQTLMEALTVHVILAMKEMEKIAQVRMFLTAIGVVHLL